MSTLVERLRDVRCNEVAFTPEHARCICRLANEAADEVARLTALLDDAQYIDMKARYARGEKSWANMLNEREARK